MLAITLALSFFTQCIFIETFKSAVVIRSGHFRSLTKAFLTGVISHKIML